jgi:hypothetical protein
MDVQIAGTADPWGIDGQAFEADDHFRANQTLLHSRKKIGAARSQTGVGAIRFKQSSGFFY